MSVLVTGGSGTLGAEVCKHLVAVGQEVVAMGRDRSRLLANCPTGVDLVTGDVRDVYRLVDICRRHKVTEIVHCAANKHVGACEEQPAAAVQVNILGTCNVLDAMMVCKINKGVFVSSDKATDGTVYGATKHLGERLVSEAAWQTGWSLNSVRPGNIIGSAGSVVDIWTRAYRQNRPITLNIHNGQAARRFVMLPSEAAELVIGALFGGPSGSCGAVIAQRMPVIDMRILAEAVAPGSPVVEAPLPREWLHQTLIGEQESVYSRMLVNQFVLDRSRSPTQEGCEYSTHHEPVMSLAQTKAFLDKRDYLPADVDRKFCS